MSNLIGSDYVSLLQSIKSTIKTTQLQSFRKINHDLIMLYFHIGEMIAKRQEQQGRGTKIIDQLSHDLIQEFGQGAGYSVRNLKYMLKFYEAYRDFPIVQGLVAQLPRGQNIEIINKCLSVEERQFYAELVIKKGLSRPVLIHQIEGGAFAISQKTVQNNFDLTLPEISDLAQSIVKDEYIFSFLGLQEPFAERELEKSLIENIKQFLLELGGDFCFMGNQYKISVGENDYFIDLLFYHRGLKRLFAIELKTQDFQPEFVGKMNFYLEALDQTTRKEGEEESIGIILCKQKDHLVVEYALRSSPKPIAVATYQITKQLTNKLEQLDILRKRQHQQAIED